MATTSEASRLQGKVNGMRLTWMTVGLLAMLGFSACGVGVDDPEGQQALMGSSETGATDRNQQALATGPEGCPTPGSTGEIPTATGEGLTNPNISSLPSDPVPWKRPTGDNELPGTNGMPPPPPYFGGSR